MSSENSREISAVIYSPSLTIVQALLCTIGQALLSLEILDKKCEHRATLDLMDEKGRKPTGGNLTVVARLREPLTGSKLTTFICV